MSTQEKQDEGFSLQDSLPIFESPPPRLRHLHCRESLLWTSAAAAAAAVVMKHRLVCSSSTSEPVRLSLIPTCRRKGHALADHAESNTLHLLCVGANRTQSLKKAVFFFFCLCSSNSSTQARALSLCICVCVDPPKAACAPLFQMTLFTDITQPPRIPRQNLISREHQRRRGQNTDERGIFAGSKPGAGLLKLTFYHACRHQEKKIERSFQKLN